MKQRLIAEHQMQRDPGGGGAEHDGAQHGRVQIAHHFFEREQHRRDGRVERGGERGAAPTGTNSRIRLGGRPRRRPRTDAIPAPTCTDGPSRPSAMPLASDAEQQPNFPSTVRKLMKPSRRNSAALVCGMPLPRALGKNRGEKITGDQRAQGRNQHPAPRGASRAGYMLAASRPVSRMKATTTSPTSTPMSKLRATVS